MEYDLLETEIENETNKGKDRSVPSRYSSCQSERLPLFPRIRSPINEHALARSRELSVLIMEIPHPVIMLC